MPRNSFDMIKTNLLNKLNNLDSSLTYHNTRHTLDVVTQAERIARAEHIEDEQLIFLIKMAALYHDSGFLQTYDGHEEAGCEIFMEDAKNMDLRETEKRLIQQLIRATKISRKPMTHLEKIICDADLDYLGRTDFYQHRGRLKKRII
jgi:uncharacterized protein